MVTITFNDFPSFLKEVTLDLIPYRLLFNWNSRGEFWTVDWRDRDENPLFLGLKLVKGIELISRYPDRGLPPGFLYVTSDTGNQEKIRKDDFINEEAFLLYVPEAEVATIQ